MTVLSAFQDAAARLVSRRPDTLFSATDAFSVEMQSLANEVARDLARTYDWQALVRTYTITPNGTDAEFPLPTDYDRMMLDTDLYDAPNWAWGYTHISRPNEWLRMKIRHFSWIAPGAWTMQGNKLLFYPAPSSSSQANFVYISKEIVTNKDGAPQALFSSDTDEFVLDERLLTLGLIWKWREMKRLESSTDQANFDKAFNEVAGKDGGSKLIRKGRYYPRGSHHLAWPWPLGGI